MPCLLSSYIMRSLLVPSLAGGATASGGRVAPPTAAAAAQKPYALDTGEMRKVLGDRGGMGIRVPRAVIEAAAKPKVRSMLRGRLQAQRRQRWAAEQLTGREGWEEAEGEEEEGEGEYGEEEGGQARLVVESSAKVPQAQQSLASRLSKDSDGSAAASSSAQQARQGRQQRHAAAAASPAAPVGPAAAAVAGKKPWRGPGAKAPAAEAPAVPAGSEEHPPAPPERGSAYYRVVVRVRPRVSCPTV